MTAPPTFGGASLTGGAVSGEVTGESLTLAVSGGTFDSKDAATGITINNPVFSFTEGDNTAAGNYALPTEITLSGTINAKSITAIGGVTVNTRDWDGTTTATFDTSAATVTGVLTAEQANFRGGLRVSGVFPDDAKTTAGAHDIKVTYTLADHGSGTGEFKASNYSISTARRLPTRCRARSPRWCRGCPRASPRVPSRARRASLNVTWAAPAADGGADRERPTGCGGAPRRSAPLATRTTRRRADGRTPTATTTPASEVTGKTSYTIEGLVAGTVYDVSVAAENSVGDRQPSPPRCRRRRRR